MRIKSLVHLLIVAALLVGHTGSAEAKRRDKNKNKEIVHDAEYYVLEAQNGEKWAKEDEGLARRLAELQKKHGRPPNLVHIMWDDTAFGDVGIPAIQKVRGLQTPNLNQLAAEGIMFTRLYTEVGCTPSRAAAMTGRLAVRNAMYNIGMLLESHGLGANEVTLAEVLSKMATPPPSTASGIWATSSRATPTIRVSMRPSLQATTRFCL